MATFKGRPGRAGKPSKSYSLDADIVKVGVERLAFCDAVLIKEGRLTKALEVTNKHGSERALASLMILRDNIWMKRTESSVLPSFGLVVNEKLERLASPSRMESSLYNCGTRYPPSTSRGGRLMVNIC